MEHKSTLAQVREFHEAFEHPIAENIGDETLEIRQLRIRLLFEELKELAEATDCVATFRHLLISTPLRQTLKEDGNEVDHVAELDALCDLQYVLDGKYWTSGHWKHKYEASTEVHNSNMSKGCSTHDKASMTVYNYSNKGIAAHIVERNGIFIVKRTADGKVLKGIDFVEPNLKQFVNSSGTKD